MWGQVFQAVKRSLVQTFRENLFLKKQNVRCICIYNVHIHIQLRILMHIYTYIYTHYILMDNSFKICDSSFARDIVDEIIDI